jgi:RNA polymerase sigma-70 factor (ECF subfamily)
VVAVAVRGTPRVSSRDQLAEELFTAHYARLAGWTANLVGDRELAHDIATESFTRLLARWTSVEDPRAYLYVIATNLVRDHWRKTERERRALSFFQDEQEKLTVAPAPDPDVRDLVDRLPEKLRMPVLLHYYADLSVADVARQLRKPEGTIKRALFDARALLLEALRNREDSR